MERVAVIALLALIAWPAVSARAAIPELFLPGTDFVARQSVARCDALAASSSKDAFRSLAICEARSQGLPEELALAVMEIESLFDPEARGGDGEVGLMQIMPATARMMGFRGSAEELFDPRTNIGLGVRYLTGAFRLAEGDLCTTVMKYRAGHAQTRFSALSVRYCVRARAILARDGYVVKGTVPEATFGFAAVAGLGDVFPIPSVAPKGVCVRRNLVPGRRYMKCVEYRPPEQARHIRSLRAKLFGG